MYSIQGLKTIGNSLPKSMNKILKKGGHNYSSIINNWSDLVGSEVAKICYPKSIKTNKELKDGVLALNVHHGNQLDVEYGKKDIADKINSFFGYEFIKQIKIILIDDKINIRNKNFTDKHKNEKINKKIDKIEDLNFKRKLSNLIKEFKKNK